MGRQSVQSRMAITYLQMQSPRSHRASVEKPELAVAGLEFPRPEINRWFYEKVGATWNWTDRQEWSEAEWHAYAKRPEVCTYLAKVDGERAGYFELEIEDGGEVQIVYFGLLSRFVGQGLGGALLSEAVEAAWALKDTRRIWLHTCTDDHPNALRNYLARGFEIYHTEG